MAVRILGIGGVEAEVTPNNALRVVPMQDAAGSRILGQGLYDSAVLGSNGAEVVIETDGISALSFQLFGIYTGTVTFFASNDGTNLFLVTAFSTTTNVGVASTTSTGAFYLPTAYKQVILRMTAYTSGAVTAVVSAQPFASPPPITTVNSTLPDGAATETTLSALNTKIPAPAIAGLLPVDTLGTPGVPRVQATAGIAATVTLTTTCRRVSMFATQGTWYSISGTATSSSHYIGAGERLDFNVPASTAISVLRETTDGFIRITELV